MTEIKEGLKNVVIAQSDISYIDGDRGELIYAGYNIHDLAENSNFEEVVYLLLHRQLPNNDQLNQLKNQLKQNRQVPEQVFDVLKSLPKATEPMAALRTSTSMLSGYDENIEDISLAAQEKRVLLLIAKIPTLVAAYERIRQGKEPIAPSDQLDHAANFLYMLRGEQPSETAVKSMDIALILHADHGFNASTFAARVTTSTLSDVYSATTSAIGTLKGPLHGGANQKVMEMLLEIQEQDPIEFVKKALAEGKKIMGFGHRVYHTEDPRATHLRRMSHQLCESTGQLKWYEMSQQIEDYMKAEKSINANVDFYSATVYYALGIPSDLYTLLFAMSRMSGWGAHILEQYKNNSLIRPRAEYTGQKNLPYPSLDKR